ncbi:T-cell surface glycoprotein CD8 alpha chain [Seriola dumerili]|uniref:T-cell surface glycoprotein CD8 alpha chain n=1 Tax=Seriola dumerili TaxID=41447 RepID=UPI000BBE1D59|nr:T-cell surface glycoprotein CD8 alpha chain [Seriola dumerili]
MDQKWIQILVILVFYQQMASGADKKAKDGDEVEIKCAPTQTSSMVMWFRVLDNSDMDYIASFDINGNLKSGTSLKTVFNNNNMKKNILTLKSFSKSRDSGLYCCATLVKNVLVFGETTRLSGVEVPTRPQDITTKPTLPTTTKACVCNKQGGKSDMFCSPIILGPLAGGCGLLLLLLIIITFYCNHTRTRRCPHHYKRKPRTMPPGKQLMTNRHV